MSTLFNKLNEIKAPAKGEFKARLDNLTEQFGIIAEIILCKGYLCFGAKHVYIRDVEFYYHEEDGGMKDPIMYHVNEKAPNDKRDYYKIGTFNFHVSGIDITFENENEKFRASALIRGFSVDDPNSKNYENRPTYLYELFNNSITPFENCTCIKWEEEDIKAKGKIMQTFRKNVPLYRLKTDKTKIILRPDYVNDGRNLYEPIPFNEKDSINNIDAPGYKLSDIDVQTVTSKKLQDTIHLWRFCRDINLKDKEWKDENGKEIGKYLP